MFRRSCFFLNAVAPPTAFDPAAHKMNSLHKLLAGEIHFKGKAPLKECNIVHQFGENWETELRAYAKKLSPEHQKVLWRQMERLKLTRYTTAELAAYAGEGPAQLDTVAREANIEQGVAFAKAKGVEEFDKYVAQEAKNANWKQEDAKKFADAVKARIK